VRRSPASRRSRWRHDRDAVHDRAHRRGGRRQRRRLERDLHDGAQQRLVSRGRGRRRWRRRRRSFAGASTIYGGGQNGIGSDGTIVEGGLGAQSEQAFENLRTVLAESRASPEDVARRWLAPAQRVAGRRRFGRVP
jgi:hypothetical protein